MLHLLVGLALVGVAGGQSCKMLLTFEGFDGSGLGPGPSTSGGFGYPGGPSLSFGLDSNLIRFQDTLFGGSSLSSYFTRGTLGHTKFTGDMASFGVTTGGVYSADVAAAQDPSLFFQPTGGFPLEYFDVRCQLMETGVPDSFSADAAEKVTASVSFDYWTLNDADKVHTWTLSASLNSSFVEPYTILSFPAQVPSVDVWVRKQIASGPIVFEVPARKRRKYFYLRFQMSTSLHSGFSDEMAFDNINLSVSIERPKAPTEPTTLASTVTTAFKTLGTNAGPSTTDSGEQPTSSTTAVVGTTVRESTAPPPPPGTTPASQQQPQLSPPPAQGSALVPVLATLGGVLLLTALVVLVVRGRSSRRQVARNYRRSQRGSFTRSGRRHGTASAGASMRGQQPMTPSLRLTGGGGSSGAVPPAPVTGSSQRRRRGSNQYGFLPGAPRPDVPNRDSQMSLEPPSASYGFLPGAPRPEGAAPSLRAAETGGETPYGSTTHLARGVSSAALYTEFIPPQEPTNSAYQ